MADIHPVATDAVVVEEHVSFTLVSLCRASGADRELVDALVSEGLLQPTGRNEGDWVFSGDTLPKVRRVARLARDLELNLSGVALVLDLLAEIEQLQSRLRQH